MKHQDEMKKKVSQRAVEIIHEKMIVGLGSGSTVAFFIEALGKRILEKLHITAVASSQTTHDLALRYKVPLVSLDDADHIDITFDGADEIDGNKRMIKGGGGALLREKIIANFSNELIIIVDETKCVSTLGRHPLPLEIVPFGHKATEEHLRKRGFPGFFRKNQDGSFLITEDNHYLFDIHPIELFKDPQKVQQELKAIPGIVETGLFLGYAGRVFIGKKDGTVEVLD